jgi:hypothetical protein
MMQLVAQEDSNGYVPTSEMDQGLPVLIKIVSPGTRMIIFL